MEQSFSPSRRHFLQRSSLALGALALEPYWGLGKKPKPAIILNTVRHALEKDLRGTLQALHDMGYRYVEGNSYGPDLASYRALLRDIGLRAIAGGTSMGKLEPGFDDFLRQAEALDYRYLVCYWPWMSDAKHLTRQECQETADRLNRLGRRAQAAGVQLCWHNHDKEFADIGGQTAFDLLMELTDPDYVQCELDLYWVYKGGAEPLALIEQHPGRFPLFHVKDMDDTDAQGKTCVGKGQLDFRPILAQARRAGLRYAIVEQESTTPGTGLDCARTSWAGLQAAM